MKIYKFYLFAFAFVLLQLFGCEQKTRVSEERESDIEGPLNVILLIGDGMGVSQVSSAFYFKNDATHFERFKHIGLINTSSASHKITDSAAGGTAFACGESTYNGAIGVDTDTADVENIIEYLSNYDYKTGLVATSSITHATPASFFAHVKSRGMEEMIAAQLSNSEVDIFIGGGQNFFEKRNDNLNYTDSLKNKGFRVLYSVEDITEIDQNEKYAVLAAEGALPPAHENRGDFLPQATETSMKYLSGNQKGFFLMVESSQIDWGGHANNGDYVVEEVLDFDNTIGKVLDFAEKDGNTLVIVTSDHETGGFTLGPAKSEGSGSNYNQVSPAFSIGGHSAALIPVFAFGPGADKFSGIYQNTEIFHKIKELLDEGLGL